MDPRTFFAFKELHHKHQGRGLRLVSLSETTGATYRKKGAKKLIHKSGLWAGLISGGCLEKEIVERSASEKRFSIDTRSEDDRLLGYGVGCEGELILDVQEVPESWEDFCKNLLNFEESLLPRIALVGTGEDAKVMMGMMKELRWPFQVFDSKKGPIEELQAQGIHAHWIQNLEPPEVELWQQQAFVLMSHSYELDLCFFDYAGRCDAQYVGVLGPKERKIKMLKDVFIIYERHFPSRTLGYLQGPIGSMDYGRGPQAIAIGVIAELQKRLYAQFY
ncbi:MAG: XdhC family protein [Pseudomonadota bacterium]